MPLKWKKAKVETEHLDGFQCDRCKAEYDGDNWIETQEYMHWKNTGGYGSVWGDGTEVEVIICQKCAYELFKDFAVVN